MFVPEEDCKSQWAKCIDSSFSTCYTDCYTKQYLTSQNIKYLSTTNFEGVSRECIDLPGSITTLLNDVNFHENNCILYVIGFNRSTGTANQQSLTETRKIKPV